MKRNHFFNGFYLWTDVEQPPSHLMFKIWPIFFSQGSVLPTANMLARIGYQTSLNAMMSLRLAIPDGITTNVRNVRIQRPLKNGLIWCKSL